MHARWINIDAQMERVYQLHGSVMVSMIVAIKVMRQNIVDLVRIEEILNLEEMFN